MSALSKSEYAARVKDVRRRMKKAGADAMIVQDRSNTVYLSGFTGSASLILVTSKSAYFNTDFRYIEKARKSIHGFRIFYPKPKDDEDEEKSARGKKATLKKKNKKKEKKKKEPPILKQLAQKVKFSTAGFEGALSYDNFREHRKAIRPAKLKLLKVVAEARKVKSEFEIALMRQAQRAAEKIFDRLLGEIKPGMTERQIRWRLLEMIEEARLDGPSFAPIIACGPHSSMCHHQPGERKLNRQDVLLIDMGVRYRGYCSDMTRTVFYGQPSPKMREIYAIVLEAQERALELLRDGANCKAVDKAARAIIKERGYGKNFGHGLGHSIGLDVHENPRLAKTSKDKLASGNVVTIEPGIYLEGRFGVRIEDMAVIRSDGCENLTRAPKSLIIL